MAFLVKVVPHFAGASPGCGGRLDGCGWVARAGATGVLTGTGASLTFPCPDQKAQGVLVTWGL